MSSAVVNSVIVDGVGIISINRPQAHNALNISVLNGIEEILDSWTSNEEVTAVIFTGSGGKAFAAGADLTELSKLSPTDVLRQYPMAKLFNRIEDYCKPTIAAVNGIALGGGFELALACDIRVAASGAKFAFPELGLGIIPGAGGTRRLTQVANRSIALHMILTREIMTAQRAFELGIVSKIADDALEVAKEIALTLSGNGPVAQRLAREAIKTIDSEGHAKEQLSQAVAFSNHQSIEGMRAFLEKRKPNFAIDEETSCSQQV
ncbi:enoyl-CoA hydratase/isomerase family protein [Corynebacterium sp. 153RC1]|uniref:enoyl-CoA hydratase/isomerase family protein n=1 Tax=unclassified Corynebacterium TaxID=2624378 RepID=UPI00211BB829|nr:MULTISPECIES: enoyl-CoA hydratase/isomerase family protein [unclassified Corynebacterium]MCQ9353427.1 enoyl-CoA hydratase/isomerase family protein [Corynebacterium sp. 209RC1]MCQ9355649.1 enoyl-CoA hydratase/isomerase family protein [Corynebacterium sp. 1222RC1]MCQ9357842.1 enoyl-CoA hydratase/isomerase family protein [Corynebacterium sp. 122RC1]MCQ9360026.1 enoyl-CoA hydratase/isomerase family protein [Corynebacterium sp. 142RC1]MCQ9362170.1 enoyl-CoA hydratase/isomerase family protein [Co